MNTNQSKESSQKFKRKQKPNKNVSDGKTDNFNYIEYRPQAHLGTVTPQGTL